MKTAERLLCGFLLAKEIIHYLLPFARLPLFVVESNHTDQGYQLVPFQQISW